MSRALFIAACGLGGLLTGVFVNVLILRGAGDRPFRPPWSRCGECDAAMPAAGLLPVFGTSAIGSACPSCGAAFGWWQPAVELVNGVLWIVAAVRFGAHLPVVPYLFLFSALLALSVIDLFTYRLPDRITYPVLYVSVPLLVIISLVDHHPRHLLWAFIGAAGYYGLLALMWLISPKGMGYGDVKLGRILGLYLGWIHIVLPIYGLGIAGILGSVIGIGVLLASRDRRRAFPFGPWLALGCVIAVAFSAQLTAGL
jgi:leader peptidase (prepilin peptidase)/N-methyltransferase